jgi:hypothetical protein
MTNTLIPAPEPGVYEKVAFETYLAWDAISNSRISLARRSLAHFEANVALEPKPCLQIGSLTHCGKLEPLYLGKRYAVMPRYEDDEENLTVKGDRSHEKTTKYYKRKAEDFIATNRDKEIVSDEQYETMVAIVTSLSRHELAREYIDSPGPMELAIVWDDPDTGLRCKARLDKVSHSIRRITDLKTYTPQQGYMSATEKFARAIANFGYHRQLAHYTNGARVLFGAEYSAALVVVENAKPHCVMAAPMIYEWLEIGRREVAETMAAIAEAYRQNQWPGYASPEAWTVPEWYGNEKQEFEEWFDLTTGEMVS